MKTNLQKLKATKQKQVDTLLTECHIFFAFSNEQLAQGIEKTKPFLSEGEKIVSIGAGGYMPKSNVDKFTNGIEAINKEYKNAIKDNKLRAREILYALNNHECFYSGDIDDALYSLGEGYTYEEVLKVYNDNKHLAEL
jgi:hypothetical protein